MSFPLGNKMAPPALLGIILHLRRCLESEQSLVCKTTRKEMTTGDLNAATMNTDHKCMCEDFVFLMMMCARQKRQIMPLTISQALP